jgi:uncharacterized membrane protein
MARMAESDTSGMAQVVGRNIEALLERRKREEDERGLEGRVADAITGFTGSMKFVYLHLALFTGWIVVNLGWLPIKPFDPSFVVLAMVASVEAIFLSTFVLISQNRMQKMADKRADLDLHISLLAEHELTRLLSLSMLMAEKMGIRTDQDLELAELAKDVLPEKVMDQMEQDGQAFSAS